MNAPRVLVVDDEKPLADAIGEYLDHAGFRSEVVYGAAAALAAIRRERPDVVLTDIRMPEWNGLDLVESIQAEAPECAVVVMTAYQDLASTWLTAHLHADAFLRKPLDLKGVAAAVGRAIEDHAGCRRRAVAGGGSETGPAPAG